MKHEFPELKPLNEQQLKLKDKVAMNLTKKNLIVFAKAFDRPESMFPKPTASLTSIRDIWQYNETRYSSRIEFVRYIYCLVKDLGYEESAPNFQLISDFAYLLACNKILLSYEGSRMPWGYLFIRGMNRRENYRASIYDLEEDIMENFDYTVVQSKVAADGAVLSAAERGVQLLSEESEFPEDLAIYLGKFESIDKIVFEVCRLQMLGPKYKRADDSKQALYDNWELYKKQNPDEVGEGEDVSNE